ncbi:MAG: peptide deformylase [Candidatus Falkowbacteria bacterium]|nr:peptide deformylase [Candidatus Falkowbacteria bacterium]
MTTNLALVINPDPRLRQRSKEINPSEISTFVDFAKDMAEAMLVYDGVGLAAVQVGKNIRLIIVNSEDGTQAMFNPVIEKKSLIKVWGEEGCLSVPETFGDLKRYKKIRCSFIDISGKKRTIDASGLMARVIQHEIDHLDGILFIDKAKNIHKVEAENV